MGGRRILARSTKNERRRIPPPRHRQSRSAAERDAGIGGAWKSGGNSIQMSPLSRNRNRRRRQIVSFRSSSASRRPISKCRFAIMQMACGRAESCSRSPPRWIEANLVEAAKHYAQHRSLGKTSSASPATEKIERGRRIATAGVPRRAFRHAWPATRVKAPRPFRSSKVNTPLTLSVSSDCGGEDCAIARFKERSWRPSRPG